MPENFGSVGEMEQGDAREAAYRSRTENLIAY